LRWLAYQTSKVAAARFYREKRSSASVKGAYEKPILNGDIVNYNMLPLTVVASPSSHVVDPFVKLCSIAAGWNLGKKKKKKEGNCRIVTAKYLSMAQNFRQCIDRLETHRAVLSYLSKTESMMSK
jgi:hypothetical protein